MSPVKLLARGIAGCRLTTRAAPDLLAVTVSLLLAEPCLHGICRAETISIELAQARGYRIVRSYDDAVASGLL